jgi:hypothetical protein
MIKKIILLSAGIIFSSPSYSFDMDKMMGDVLSDVLSEVAPARNENSTVSNTATTHNKPDSAEQKYVLQVAERCLQIWSTSKMKSYCGVASEIEQSWISTNKIPHTLTVREEVYWKSARSNVEPMFENPPEELQHTIDIPIDYSSNENLKKAVFARCDGLKQKSDFEASNLPSNPPVIGRIAGYYCDVISNEISDSGYFKSKEAMAWKNAQIAFNGVNGIIAYNNFKQGKNEERKQQQIADTQQHEKAIADLKQEQKSAPIVNGQWKRFDILTADHAVGVMSSDRKSVLAVTCTMGNLTAMIDWQIMMIPKTVMVAVDGYISNEGWHNYKSTSNFDVELIKAMMNAKGNIVATAETQRHTKKKQFFSPRGSTKMIGEMMEYCGY